MQENHSRSHKGVLCGLHSQIERPQCKLVGVTEGDVALERPDSPILASIGVYPS